MEEAHDVLARLARIEALERVGASPAELLGELRELVREAERRARREADAGALAAAARCRDALARGSAAASPKTYATQTIGG
jgi:hypothetical protein